MAATFEIKNLDLNELVLYTYVLFYKLTMAKSLKSKWKRKMRAVKRERYGKKELEKLKTMLGLNTTDVDMKEEKLNDIAIVKDANEVKEQVVNNKLPADQAEDHQDDTVEICEPMDDGRKSFNKKTLKDQHGNYPVWLGSRKLKKIVKRNQTAKKGQKKKGKKGGKSR